MYPSAALTSAQGTFGGGSDVIFIITMLFEGDGDTVDGEGAVDDGAGDGEGVEEDVFVLLLLLLLFRGVGSLATGADDQRKYRRGGVGAGAGVPALFVDEEEEEEDAEEDDEEEELDNVVEVDELDAAPLFAEEEFLVCP